MRQLLWSLKRVFSSKGTVLIENNDYFIKVAENEEEKQQVYKLRYKVFCEELKEVSENESKTEIDQFDEWADYLIIVEKKSQTIVGTYRIIPWFNKPQKYYSEQRYDLSGFPQNNIAEIGRFCFSKEHRGKHLMLFIWLGMFEYFKRNNVKYMFGVMSMRDEATLEDLHRIYQYCMTHNYYLKAFKAIPHKRVPNITDPIDVSVSDFKELIPEVLKKYLKGGGVVAGEPSGEKMLEVYHFLMILNTQSMKIRQINNALKYKHYLLDCLKDNSFNSESKN